MKESCSQSTACDSSKDLECVSSLCVCESGLSFIRFFIRNNHATITKNCFQFIFSSKYWSSSTCTSCSSPYSDYEGVGCFSVSQYNQISTGMCSNSGSLCDGSTDSKYDLLQAYLYGTSKTYDIVVKEFTICLLISS